MKLHCTKKLAKKLAKKLNQVAPDRAVEANPLGDWHANLYIIDRRNCVLCCHDETRYTVFLSGLRKEHFADFPACFRKAFTGSLHQIGVPRSQVNRAQLAMGGIEFDSQTNRSVLGSLNQMQFMLQHEAYSVDNVMSLDPVAVSAWLSHYPVSTSKPGRIWMADEAMIELVAML